VLIKAGSRYSPLLRFPGVKQDITLKVPSDLLYEDLYDFVSQELGANTPDDTHVRLNLLDIYQKDDDTNHKQFTFRVTITADSHTLTDTEVNKLLDEIAANTKAKLSAERI
jgi:phenylalanyl-tRNA synthetase beta subunit